MDFFKNLGVGGATASEAPPSVLAEWNKYSTGDIEAGSSSQSQPAPSGATGGSYLSLLPGVTAAFPGASAGSNAPSSSSSMPSFRIPTGTDFVYFSALICGAGVFFFMAFFVFLPLIVFAPAKFALAFTFGSLCTMGAMTMLTGWKASVQHMFSAERLPFTAVYLGSMCATLYAAVMMKSYVLSFGFSVIQVLALLYYILSYFPGGAQGMQFLMGMVARGATSCIGTFTRGST